MIKLIKQQTRTVFASFAILQYKMLLKLFQTILCAIFLIFSSANSQNDIKSSSSGSNEPLSSNLNPTQPLSSSGLLSKSESGFHSSGIRGNYEGSGVFNNNNKNRNLNSYAVDQEGVNLYATPNVAKLFETLRTKTTKWRFNAKNLDIPVGDSPKD